MAPVARTAAIVDRMLMLRERDDANLSTDLAWLERLIADERGPATEEHPS